MFQESYLVPVAFNFKVRKGANQVCIECFWLGLGSIEVKIQALNKVYTEENMKVTEKTTISVSDLTMEHHCYKKCVLSIPPPSKDEFWRLELALVDVPEYQLNIEVS